MIKVTNPYSIAFSLAYTHVCEWAKGAPLAVRPKPDELRLARKHAEKLGDDYILEKIKEAHAAWERADLTPTPRNCLPGPTPEAMEIGRELTDKVRVFQRPAGEADKVVVFKTHKEPKPLTSPYSMEMLSEEEKVDFDVDRLLAEGNMFPGSNH